MPGTQVDKQGEVLSIPQLHYILQSEAVLPTLDSEA